MGKLQIECKPIEKVIPYDKNSRWNDDAVQYVAESIKEFGFINPILLDDDILEKKAQAHTNMSMCDIPCRMTAPNAFVAQTMKERIAPYFI